MADWLMIISHMLPATCDFFEERKQIPIDTNQVVLTEKDHPSMF